MPLGDHFHSPWMDENHWESFHSAWINTIVRHLNGFTLPRRYRAIPQVHLGAMVEADVAAFDVHAGADAEGGGALATAVWSPPAPSWPRRSSGPIIDAPGETWKAGAAALHAGARGLPRGSSLARLVEPLRRP